METPVCNCVCMIECEWYISLIFDAHTHSVEKSQGHVCACHCKEEIPPVYLHDKPLETRMPFQCVSVTRKSMEPSIIRTKISGGDQPVQFLEHTCV